MDRLETERQLEKTSKGVIQIIKNDPDTDERLKVKLIEALEKVFEDFKVKVDEYYQNKDKNTPDS